MNKNDVVTVLFSILLVCFFIPFIGWDSYEMSGFNFILSSNTPDVKYILLLIPLSALLGLSKAINERQIRYIPLCISVGLFIICFANGSKENPIWKVLDYGYWITLVTSLILVFVKPGVKQF